MYLPKRKPTRLQGYDYSQNGAYFITICTHDRKCVFWENHAGAINESTEIKINEYGKIAEQIIERLPDRYYITIPKYVIMPNHIHMIIEITENEKHQENKEIRHYRSVTDKAVGYLKMNVSKKMHNTYPGKIWQRSYHDHIIRGDSDYKKIWEYIDTNPIKWKLDCFYTDEKTV